MTVETFLALCARYLPWLAFSSSLLLGLLGLRLTNHQRTLGDIQALYQAQVEYLHAEVARHQAHVEECEAQLRDVQVRLDRLESSSNP